MGRRTIRSVVGALVLAAGIVAVPAVALGQEAAPADAVPTLAEAMTGEAEGLEVEAFSAFDTGPPDVMLVELEVANAGDAAATFTIPYGTLLETGVEDDQTFGTAGPYDDPAAVAAAQRGEAPTVTAPPGESIVQLTVFCTQRDDGAPFERTPLTYAGMAAEPLPTVLRNIVAQEADPVVAQDAVWWVTDEPTFPVPEEIAPLLEGTDPAAFAEAPHAVIPDTQYTPHWERAAVADEAFDNGGSGPVAPLPGGGSGAGLVLWLVVLALGAALIGFAVHKGRQRPAAVPVRAAMGPGWYPDPYGRAAHRYFDGRGWTDRVM